MQGRLGRGRYSDHSVHPVVERHVLAHLHVPAADKSDVRWTSNLPIGAVMLFSRHKKTAQRGRQMNSVINGENKARQSGRLEI